MPGAIPATSVHQAGSIPSGDASTRFLDDIANRPAASPQNYGFYFAAEDTGVLYQSDGSMWIAIADLGGGGGGGSALEVLDEGVSLDSAVASINLVGTLITGTNIGHAVTITVATPTAGQVGLGNVLNVAQIPASWVDTDGTLAANLDTKIATQKATKTYVDALASTTTSALALKAPIASPTFTGTVTIPNGAVLGTPASATLTNATGLPEAGVTGLVADLLATNKKAANLSDVAAANTSRYNLHDQVLAFAKAAGTANVASKSGTTTIDGVALAANDLVLLVGQTAGAENGPWLVQAGAWTRPLDYPAGGTVIARMIEVAGGVTYTGTLWVSLATTAVTIDTTATVWRVVAPRDGWIPAPHTWVYVTATSFKIVGVDLTTTYRTGTRVSYNDGAVDYGTVATSSFTGGDTVVLLDGNDDYSIANTTLTLPRWSYLPSPPGFPDWFGHTPTLAGWSSNPTNTLYKFRRDGDMVTMLIRQGTAGTSNNVTHTMSLPANMVARTDASAQNAWLTMAATQDSGTNQYGFASVSNGAAVISLTGNGATQSNTASGSSRFLNCTLIFRTAANY